MSTTVIAERAGMSQAAIFKRYPTKKALMCAALLPPEHPPYLELLAAGPHPSLPLGPQLEEAALAIARFFAEVVPCIATLHASGFEKSELFGRYEVPPPLRTRQALAEWFARAAAQGRLAVTAPTEVATAFMGTLHVRAFLQHVGSVRPGAPTEAPEPLEVYVRTVVSIFLQGIGARP